MVVARQEDIPAFPDGAQSAPYQRLLRSIGAYLDAQLASQIYVLETDDGFLVRYQSPTDPSGVTSVRLSLEDLVVLDCRRQGRRTPEQSDATKVGRYQDFLRSIGYELEQVSARHIVLDEVDRSYTLTYHCKPPVGVGLRKNRMTITPAEEEELLRRARARRRSDQPGWLSRSAEASRDPVRVVRLMGAEPVLEHSPAVLYDYTIPSLKANTVALLQAGGVGKVYQVRRSPQEKAASLEQRLVEPLEAARLISAVYSRCLDPVRMVGTDRDAVDKEQIVATFARSLTGRKVLGAVETVAANIDNLRLLDAYQEGLGSNTVRWMQYLAGEALAAITPGPSSILPEQGRLHQALTAIQSSVTGVERFAAIRRLRSVG